jgi:hypothetical protein
MKATLKSCEVQSPAALNPYVVANKTSPAGKINESNKKCSDSKTITSSSFTIAWSIVILVFLTFYNQYLAYYQIETVEGVSHWIRYPILTEAFFTWLPIFITTLVLLIIGHIILIRYSHYLIQGAVMASLRLCLLATALSLYFIFPFDFTAIPDSDVASIFQIFARVSLIILVIGLIAGIIVTLVKLIVRLSKRQTTA